MKRLVVLYVFTRVRGCVPITRGQAAYALRKARRQQTVTQLTLPNGNLYSWPNFALATWKHRT